MHAIKAVWINGRIVPSEPVDRPEASQLLVESLPVGEKIGPRKNLEAVRK
jgi:hypothetical protein